MKKAVLEVSRPRAKKKIIHIELRDNQTLEDAQLNWLNGYINRDCKVCVCENLKHAKQVSKLNIKARWV